MIEEQANACWPGEAAILIKNTTDGWSGWFPIKDIDIVESKKRTNE
jgi:hypothetical protein